MKGLIQIEILSQLEEQTGRRITELFDWIVGTSTGGIIALALVHGALKKFPLNNNDNGLIPIISYMLIIVDCALI